MVHVVGYLSNTDLLKKIPTAPPGAGGGYFIIKNSWGACDGDAGYKYMPVDYFEAEVWDLWTLPAIVD
jgi:C1A family cysteine protease